MHMVVEDAAGPMTNTKETEDKEITGTMTLRNILQLEVETVDQVELNNRDGRILQATSKNMKIGTIVEHMAVTLATTTPA